MGLHGFVEPAAARLCALANALHSYTDKKSFPSFQCAVVQFFGVKRGSSCSFPDCWTNKAQLSQGIQPLQLHSTTKQQLAAVAGEEFQRKSRFSEGWSEGNHLGMWEGNCSGHLQTGKHCTAASRLQTNTFRYCSYSSAVAPHVVIHN